MPRQVLCAYIGGSIRQMVDGEMLRAYATEHCLHLHPYGDMAPQKELSQTAGLIFETS